MRKSAHSITVELWAAFCRHLDNIEKGCADWEAITNDFSETTSKLYGQGEKFDKLISDLAFGYLDFLTALWREVNNGHSNNQTRA